MRCANCGNEDEKTLWDEGDTIYCSLCAHRTRISDGEDWYYVKIPDYINVRNLINSC